MSWTLWRGDDLLGTVHQRSVPDAVEERNGRRTVNAVLVPDPACLPLPSVWQHVPRLRGSTTVEHVLEPHVTSLERRVEPSSAKAIGIWPVSSEPAPPPPGVPPAR